MKNRSVTRTASYEQTGLDDFPTPPWATRAFFKYVAPELMSLNKNKTTFRDPCCGRGHMMQAIRSLGFKYVNGSDIKDYGDQPYATFDYLGATARGHQFQGERGKPLPLKADFYFANPPYKFGTQFANQMLKDAKRGVALLARTLWAEGGKETAPRSRWNKLFKHNRPHRIGLISARMPATQGRVIQHHPVFMSHSWFYWDLTAKPNPPWSKFIWIPPEAQRLLEHESDYKIMVASTANKGHK